MSEPDIPAFGALLAPYISQVPPEATPRFLALLERGAAARYREWAAMLPEHGDVLLSCAASEDEIADRTLAMLQGALAELAVRPTDVLASDVGPVPVDVGVGGRVTRG